MRIGLVISIVALGWLLTACGPPLNSQVAVAQAALAPTVPAPTSAITSTTCPVTQSPATPFKPPSPYPAVAPYPTEFWHGTSDLWTMLPKDGQWRALPHNPDGYTQKVLWWRDGYNGAVEQTPKLTVTGRRLDGPAPPLVASTATNAYHPDILWAMLVGVDVPTPGCWEITGKYQDHELSFVVWVAP